jgi:Domain of unknown function (DUF5666)
MKSLFPRILLALFCVAGVALVSGCGSDTPTSSTAGRVPTATPIVPAAGQAVFLRGEIQEMSGTRVRVQGIDSFVDSNTDLQINGRRAPLSSFRLGMGVRVDGVWNGDDTVRALKLHSPED